MNLKIRPFFSVIMPVFNGEEYLKFALDSVLAQTFENWEMVIVDDTSTDSTPQIIRDYMAKDSRIRTRHNDKNMFSGGSNNRGIEIASGLWMTHIDCDDIYHPQYLERLYEKCSALPDMNFFMSTWTHIIDEKGDRLLPIRLPNAENVRKFMPIENFLYHSATSFPKKLWQIAGGYPYSQKGSDDLALWTKFFKIPGVTLEIIPESLVDYRIHYNNITFAIDGHRTASHKAALKRNAEWKISLFMKQRMQKEARKELISLFRTQHYTSVKNLLYFVMTFLPIDFAHAFMWEFRPKMRSFLRLFRGRIA